MCGIAGILSFDGSPPDQDELLRMSSALRHRGPDGEGVVCEEQIGLAHRRLSILDPTPRSDQPLTYANGRYVGVYNGEVYNFLDVRRDLRRLGCGFDTDGDSEVVLAAYHRWGPECLEHFNGMWAFAIWDRLAQELFLARDRFGVKPLVYFRNSRRLAFASEIKGLGVLPDCPRDPNLRLIRSYLARRPIEGSEQTVVAGVSRLLPGHWMRVSAGATECRKWWETADHLVEVPGTSREREERFSALFEESCRLRLTSDVAVGSLLSGGVDSSSIVCTIWNLERRGLLGESGRRIAADWQRAYIGELPGSRFDEGPLASLVLERFGVKGVRIPIERPDMVEKLRQLVLVHDRPVSPSLLAVHPVYAAVAADGVKVTLDGQGSDEMLSGYGVRPAISHFLKHGSVRQAFLAARHQAAMDGNVEGALGILGGEAVAIARGTVRLRSRVRSVAGGPPNATAAPHGVLAAAEPSTGCLRSDDELPAMADPVTRRCYADFHDTILPQILTTYDIASMAHGVESRMPFLDWRLVTFVFSLPIDGKVHDGYNKVVLRNSMAGIVPDEILRRRLKLGFPIAPEWFDRSDVRREMREVFAERSFERDELWVAATFRRWFDAPRPAGWNWSDIERATAVLSVHLWIEQMERKPR